jgi:large subunit ribosomal protein L35
MPKLKTKSSVKKRFRLTGTGKVKMTPAGKRHGMRKRSNKFLRNARGMKVCASMETKRIRTYYLHV